MKYQHQLGRQTQRVERRYGTNGMPAPGGVCTEKPGGSVPAHQFLRLVNNDWLGNGIIPRPGQERIHGNDVIHDAAARVHPHDFRMGCATRLWHVGDGCPGQSLSAGFFVGHYDQEQDPQVQRASWYSLAVNNVAIGSYAGQPYVAVDDTLWRLQTIPVPYGTEQLVLAGAGSDLPAATFPGFRCNAMMEFDGLFHLVLQENGTGTHKTMTYDGKTLRDDLTGIAAASIPVALGTWRDSLVLGYVSAANRISVRERGASPGTWAHVAPGAGTIATQPGRNSIVSYKDEVYIASGGADLWNYDGTTLAVGRTVAGATIACVEEAFGYLFYGYKTSGNAARLGRYDNTTYTDVHKALTADEPAATFVDALRYYRDSLAVSVRRTSLQSAIMESPGPTTSGTWITLPQVAGLASSNAIRYMLVL